MSDATHTNDVAMGTLLLANPLASDSLLERVRAFAPEARVAAAGEAGDTIVQYRHGSIDIYLTPIDASNPDQEVVDYIHPILTEEDEIPHLINHTAQLLVVAARLDDSGSGEEGADKLEVRQAHAEAVRNLIGLDEAVGFTRPGTTMGLRALREQLADATQTPVYLYAPVWLWAGEDGMTAYTFGLADFGSPELQVVDSSEGAVELFTLMCDLVSYVTTEQAQLKGGDTLSYGDFKDIGLQSAQWLVDGGREAVELSL